MGLRIAVARKIAKQTGAGMREAVEAADAAIALVLAEAAEAAEEFPGSPVVGKAIAKDIRGLGTGEGADHPRGSDLLPQEPPRRYQA